MVEVPKCPECGTVATFCDPNGIEWICSRCAPDGMRFSIAAEDAEEHADAHRESLHEMEEYARRRYTPPPK